MGVRLPAADRGRMKRVAFKCEDSLWRMLASGEKTWDARRYDLSDERIDKLSRSWYRTGRRVKEVSFENKASGDILNFEFKELVLGFSWAPDWCFIILGKEISRQLKACT